MSGPIIAPLTVTTDSGSPEGRPITTIKVSNGDLTVSGNIATIDTSGAGGLPGTPANSIQFNSDPAGTFTGSERLLFETGSNNGRLEMKTGASATQAEIRAMDGWGLQISGTDVAASAVRNQIVLFGENDAPDGILLMPNAGENVVIHTGGLTTSGSSGDLVLSTYDDEDKAKITLEAGADGGIVLQTDNAGVTQLENTTTDADSVLSIMGNGTGDAKLDLQNASKRVWVMCDENKKVKIMGGSGGNTFILDVSGAATGITFPDGTTQTTAASGGGATLDEMMGAKTLTGTNTRYETAAAAPYGSGANGSTNAGVIWLDDCFLYPFIAVVSGQLTEFGTQFGSGSSGGINFAVYDSDATTQMPDTLLAQANLSYSASSGVYQTSLTAPTGSGVVGSLVAGEVYWCCYTRDTAGTDTVMSAVTNATRSRISPIAAVGNTNGMILSTSDYDAGTTFPDTFSTTNLVPENNYLPRFSYKVT